MELLQCFLTSISFGNDTHSVSGKYTRDSCTGAIVLQRYGVFTVSIDLISSLMRLAAVRMVFNFSASGSYGMHGIH